MSNIQGIIFDYGGTIDSCGDHWATVLRKAYEICIPSYNLGLLDFTDAYAYAEKTLNRDKLVGNDFTFEQTMKLKIELQFARLAELDSEAEDIPLEKAAEISRYCRDFASRCIEIARPTLDYLTWRYPMVLVSNFYGNLNTVLREFDLDAYFLDVVESSVVGLYKPDPAIFLRGAEILGIEPENLLVVGDSLTKDILPAEKAGFKTAWLKGRQWYGDAPAPKRPDVIRNLDELQKLY